MPATDPSLRGADLPGIQPLIPMAEQACARVQQFAAFIALFIGTVNIAVWLGPARAIMSWPGMMVMRMNSAVAISAAGLSLALWYGAAPGSRRRHLAQLAGLCVLAIGGLTAFQDVFGINLQIDQLLMAGSFPGDLAAKVVKHPGRMSFNASLSLLFLGAALVGLDGYIRAGRTRRIYTASGFALLALLPAACGLVGYLVGARQFTGLLKSTPILLHAAGSLLVLSVGTLAARPHREPVCRLLSPGIDGLFLRWLMPASITLLLAQAWLITLGRGRGLVQPGEGTALMLYGSLVLLSGLMLLVSKVAAIQEASARRAEAAYRTELVRAKEAAEYADHAKDHFLAALSHELRTPLTPVLLSAAALRRDQRLPPEVRADLTMIERNVGLEARLIDDLLDLTRIARGKLTLHKELCDAHALLGHAVEMVRDEAEKKHLTFDLEFTASRCGLSCDPARLQQVFWNLLKNAVKFTPPDGHISITTRDEPTAGQLQLVVKDTGVGFAGESAEGLFQAFEQGGLEVARRFGGLGLGLSIARAIVDLHGGTIRAWSPGAGHGATFTVELPGATEPPSSTVADSTPTSPPSTDKRPHRILLVDDHEPTLTILAKLLRRNGHEVVTASSVAAALAADLQGGFQLLITDLGLPDGSGHDLMTQLRARHPALSGIALSGFGQEKDLQRSRDAGFFCHLVKPIDFAQLSDSLNRIFTPVPAP